MRRTLILALVVATTSCSSTEPPAEARTVCCDDGESRRARSGTCAVGEVEVASVACAATEHSDAGASSDASSDAGHTAPMCGDQRLEHGEICERNADCMPVDTAVCRQCDCADRSAPTEFLDATGDLASGVTTTWADIAKVAMTIDGPPSERFDVWTTGALRNPTTTFKICLHLVRGGSETGRLCLVQEPSADADLLYSEASRPERSVLGASAVTLLASGIRIDVDDAIGLSYEPGMDFYWTTEAEGMVADRLPDTGMISMVQILGQ